MNRKAIGSILMILGTSIGAGMLALPVVTAQESFWMSLGLMVLSWFIMTFGAFSLLEVNLWLPQNTNMVSMAAKTLGQWGKIVTWAVYLLLLYSLLCAYLSGISDIVQGLLQAINIPIPRSLATVLSLLLFGLVVYKGISSVDLVNRGLMSIKMVAYLLLVFVVSKFMHVHFAFEGNYLWQNSTFMVMLTSFGFATIIPSIRTYLDSDVQLLKRVIWIGSLIPLVIYLIWIFVIQSLIAKTGNDGLLTILSSSHINTLLMQSITHKVNAAWISDLAKIFISICAVTSFLGVSICLTDFLRDGLNHQFKKQVSNWVLYGLVFVPPLLIVLLSPGIFVKALNYAGVLCLILLIILPILMLYYGRYKKNISNYQIIPENRLLVLSSFIVGIVLLSFNLF